MLDGRFDEGVVAIFAQSGEEDTDAPVTLPIALMAAVMMVIAFVALALI